ncbi:MAG: IS630 family transposase [Gammaproteobacteria bacterium]|nr:IS630 family transposase [Gammaproteobacteria bacterium]
MPRPVRRRRKRIVINSRDKDYVRRAQALLHLADRCSVSATARRVFAARSSVGRWRALYEDYGEAGLAPEPRGRSAWTVTEALRETLSHVLQDTPEAYGYLRSRWSSGLLALVLERVHGLRVHASTVRRLLPRLGFAWRRARPWLNRRDPRKSEKLQAIERVLSRRRPATEVFYVDEADIDLNPRIGPSWTPRGRQGRVITPGQNEKHYLAGALHARTGRVVWVEHPRKNSELFLRLLEALRRTYRAARELVLILDNYIIHKSVPVRQWLADNPKFTLVFQPTYSPWVNRIERLWKTLHDTVTRNHRCKSLRELAQRVIRFLEAVSPFPGIHHALASLGI